MSCILQFELLLCVPFTFFQQICWKTELVVWKYDWKRRTVLMWTKLFDLKLRLLLSAFACDELQRIYIYFGTLALLVVALHQRRQRDSYQMEYQINQHDALTFSFLIHVNIKLLFVTLLIHVKKCLGMRFYQYKGSN